MNIEELEAAASRVSEQTMEIISFFPKVNWASVAVRTDAGGNWRLFYGLVDGQWALEFRQNETNRPMRRVRWSDATPYWQLQAASRLPELFREATLGVASVEKIIDNAQARIIDMRRELAMPASVQDLSAPRKRGPGRPAKQPQAATS